MNEEIIDVIKDEEEIEVVEKPSFISKCKNFAKKNGKKIAAVAAVAAVGVAGYVFGKRANAASLDFYDDIISDDEVNESEEE